MSTPEDDLRKKEQDQALDLYRSPGAIIEPEYLTRKQRYFPVTKDDLEDIKKSDKIEDQLVGIGSFCASGSFWLYMEDYFSNNHPIFSNKQLFCLSFFIIGFVFIYFSRVMSKHKKDKIDTIINQTQRLN